MDDCSVIPINGSCDTEFVACIQPCRLWSSQGWAFAVHHLLYGLPCTGKCHGELPKLGDKNEWSRRLSNGLDQATDRAVKGFGAMPPKGGCMDCTRDEIRRAIQFMANPNASN